MSPLCIRILLHYYYSPKDYQRVEDSSHANSDGVLASLAWFVRQDLLKSRFSDLTWACEKAVEEASDDDEPIFKITEKGRAMVGHLCEVSIPVCKWVRPEEAA